MRLTTTCSRAPSVLFLFVGILLSSAAPALAQRSGSYLELHAGKHATATMIGLPDYPGARSYSESSNDSSADVGFTFGDIHFRLLISKYITSASPAQVLAFYHKPLARYGEVLDCENGEAVGPVKVAKGGLTCSDDAGHHSGSDDQRSTNEIRSGAPERYRIVAIDGTRRDSTRFSLVLIEVPRKTASTEMPR